MRYSAELAARLESWLALPVAERRSAAGLLSLSELWAAVQGLPTPPICRQCQYSDRVHDLNAYLREYARLTSSSSLMATADAPQATYQFKPDYAGQTLTADDYGKAVTADNLTDEDAEHFIKKGFGHVFQKVGAAAVGAGEKLEGAGDGLADDSEEDEPTEREQELQGQVDDLKQKLAEQTSGYNDAYNRVVTDLTTEKAAHTTTTGALDSERQAHATTKQQLSEVQQQLADAQTTIAKLKAKPKPTASGAAPTASATVPAPADAAPISSPTAGTDASADAATGSN